ncbi:MAG: ShlB/FhaC/HecB family hemolysin secretion/activation protein [Pseudomonadota bacterium]|nr:ShlB/FhaC/HecB family hemolysin secretion/activation protein [Pseudomonadota bacterium]
MGCAMAAQAQAPQLNLPDPVAEQRRAQERQQEQQQRIEQQSERGQPEAPAVATPTNPYARLPSDESPCFILHRIQFQAPDGQAVAPALMSGLDTAVLMSREPDSRQRVDDSPIDRCVGANGINTLLERAQNHLIDRGYITSRALAGAQDLKSGVLNITIVPGYVTAIRAKPAEAVEGAEPTSGRHIGAAGLYTALPTGAGRLLNLRDIEQGLENLKRAPTADADIQIVPADPASLPAGAPAFGQSELQVAYQQGRPVRFGVSLDDSGTRGTGKYQGGITFSVDSPLGLNDLFYVSLNHGLAGSARGTRGHVISYSIPFGYWTLGANWNANRYHQTVAGASQSYVYRGHGTGAEVFASRVLYRDAQRKTMATIKGWHRTSRNFIDDTEIEVQRRRVGGWAAQIGHREYFGKSSLDLNVAYKRGTGAFGTLAAPEEGFGEGTSRFALITADASLNIPFTVGDQPFRYQGQWRWQTHRTPLTPQDRMAIGGRYTVRGFDGENSLMGERGWLLRNDLGWQLPQAGLELYLGLDYGRVGGPSTPWQLGRSLGGAVLGVRGSGSGAAKGLSYDFFIGAPVHKPSGFKTASTTFGFNLHWQF